MPADGLLQLGYILKTHGLTGAVKLKVTEPAIFPAETPRAFFVDIEDPPIPCFIESIRETRPDECIVKFEDFNSLEAAKKLQGRSVFLEHDPADDPSFVFQRLTGYRIIDTRLGPVGTIEAVIEMPGQYMAQLFLQGQEVLIPLNDDLVVEVNDAEQQIQMALPEGLLEVFGL